MKRLVLGLLSFGLYSTALSQLPYSRHISEREIQELKDRGLDVRIHANTIDAIGPSNQRFVFTNEMSQPRELMLSGVPRLALDLRVIDTNQYNWRFAFESTIPLSAGWGYPMLVTDYDQNGKGEAYGIEQDDILFKMKVFEFNSSSSWIQKHDYSPLYFGPEGRVDFDANGLSELTGNYGDSLFVLEQTTPNSIPTRMKSRFRRWFYSATGIPNEFHDMDGDGRPELLHRGSEPDSTRPPYGAIEATYTTKYFSGIERLIPVWRQPLPANCDGINCTSSIAPGDFDGDGKQEFATSNFDGQCFVVENVADDSCAVTWTGTIPVGARAAAGDVDGNGLTEFFLGGDQSEPDGLDHTRVVAFERTGDNSYSPTYEFDIFPTGRFFVTLFLTRDVDGDGRPELLISFAGGIVIFRGGGPHSYETFYYRAVSGLEGVSAAAVDTARVVRLFISRRLSHGPIYTETDVLRLDSSLVSTVAAQNVVRKETLGAYPNPFNTTVELQYRLDRMTHIQISVLRHLKNCCERVGFSR